MLAIRTVLHPTDLSAGSEIAFWLACSLARDYSARLVVLHVAEPPLTIGGEGLLALRPDADMDSLRGKLQQLRPWDPKAPVEHRLVQGYPVAEILRMAEETKCDVIVLGTHARPRLGRLLMGSVAEQVVRRAPCPVVTVKMPQPAARSAAEPISGTAGGTAEETTISHPGETAIYGIGP